jgi:hypothetical protein
MSRLHAQYCRLPHVTPCLLSDVEVGTFIWTKENNGKEVNTGRRYTVGLTAQTLVSQIALGIHTNA